MFSALTKKVVNSDTEQAEIIAETYAGIFEYAFKGADSQEAELRFHDAFQQLVNLYSTSNKITQFSVSLCMAKII